MMNRRNTRLPRRASQSGFSLIEIVIVITLIALIAAFVVNKVAGQSDRAKVKLATVQVQDLAEKVQQFENDTGSLPNSLDDLVTAPSNVSGWLGPYTKPAGLKDPWNHTLEYRVPGDGKPFDLICLGKDGKPGGSSVDADIAFE